jgi:hypothetical protein
MDTNYDILIRKLDEFIRKFYKNQLIRGALYAITALFAFFIIINILEYFAYFVSIVRAILFWSYIGGNVFIIVKYIGIPLFRLFKIGEILTHDQAAKIIGRHFGEVQDVLLNTLQLKKMAISESLNIELLQASINQKIARLKPVPFNSAIDLSKNRKYIKYALPPVLVLLVIIVAAPSLITGPSKRLVEYTTYFEKPAPFQFNILNEELEAVQQEDFVLDVKLTGEEIPDELYIVIGSAKYRLNKENTVLFHYTFSNLQKNTKFYLLSEDFRSRDYELNVIAKPIVLNFEIELNYPGYINKKDETVENSGDIVVPYGTKATWRLNTRDTKGVIFRFLGKTVNLKQDRNNTFSYSQQCLLTQNYCISMQNQYVKNKDSMQYAISVIPDQYPGINVEFFKDSVYDKRLYFTGNIHDDYGCSRLLFKYYLLKKGEENMKDVKPEIKTVPILSGSSQQQFYYYFDLNTIEVNPGDVVEYYFEVWDNDGVNGSKATRSQKMVFKAPTIEEIQKLTEKTNDQIKQEMEDAIRQSQQLQKDLDKMDKKLTDKKTLNWQEKKQIQDLIDKQQNLQKEIDQLKLQNQQNNIREQEYKKQDPEILEKQQMLEKLFNEVMTDEMKELMQKLQEMLDKADKNQVNEMLDKMKLSNEDMKKELDRNLELFKQLEFDKKLQETIDKIDKLAEEQKKLSEESKNDNINEKEIKTKQDSLNSKFDDIRKDLDDLEKKNMELEDPNNLKNTDDKENSIQEQMNQSSDQLQKNKKSGASKSQESAAEQMQELSDQLQQMQQEMEEESYEEDINSLRQILENLVSISFGQEDVMKQLSTVNLSDPRYIKIMDRQKELKDDIILVKDSLYALSKRQPMIEGFVNREMNMINENMKTVLDALHNRNVSLGTTNQQYVMTAVNNLALLLAETLQQMQQQAQQSSCKKSGKSGKCSKPGQGKPSASSMKKMQAALQKKIQDMKDQMEGKSPGKQGNGQQSASEQLARLAAEQEALRKMMQEYGQEDKINGGKNSGNINEMLKNMEQTEQDLVNKMVTNETLKRQQEILTRLLESEKAEKEREFDEKRESNESKNQNFSNPNDFFKYNTNKLKEIELLKTVPPTLKSFYKQKVNEYFYNFAE